MDDETSRGRLRRGPVAAVVAVVLVVVVAVVVWLAVRSGDDQDSAQPNATSSPTSGATVSGQETVPTGNPTATPPPAPTAPTNPPKPRKATFRTAAPAGSGVTAEITDVESVTGKARGPGEIAGPALRFTVRVTNRSGKTLDLDLALLNVYFGAAETPASDLSGPGARRLPQKLGQGSATGRYVFNVPTGQRGRLRADFSYTTAAPTVIFRGSAG